MSKSQTTSVSDKLSPNTLTYLAKLNLSQPQLRDFCQRWQINKLALFGSVTRDDFGPKSDVDVLVSFLPQAKWSLFDLINMEEALSDLLNRKVDLITWPAVEQHHNPFRRREILSTAQVIYDQG